MKEQSVFASIIKVARLKFLINSALAYSLGTLLCLYTNYPFIQSSTYLLGLITVWLVHIMTHFFNEYYDLEADKANKLYTNNTGGSRVLADGHLKPFNVLIMAFVFLSINVCLAFLMPNKVSCMIVLMAIFIGYAYTAPPFYLNYNKLGELSVATTLSFLTPLIGFSMQTGFVLYELIVLLVPVFIFQFTRMLIMNLADYEGDILVNKITLASALGPSKTVYLYGTGQFLAYVILIPMCFFELIPVPALIVYLTLPIAVWQFFRIKNTGFSNRHIANSITFWASTQYAIIMMVLYAGLIIELVSQKDFFKNNTQNHQVLLLILVLLVLLVLIGIQVVKSINNSSALNNWKAELRARSVFKFQG